jgi:hypothetical protein
MLHKSLSKKELISIIEELHTTLSSAIDDAKEAAKEYPSDHRGQLAFEVGYLSGCIKSSVALIKEALPVK